jgi:hypothetical protein
VSFGSAPSGQAGREALGVETDQELFAKGLAAYQQVVGQNYMAHREVYGLLHKMLVSEALKQFVFLDIACGTATGSTRALRRCGASRREAAMPQTSWKPALRQPTVGSTAHCHVG